MYQTTVLEFLNMGGGEIMLILAVVLLLFGGKKLPELARGLGKGIRDFKDASEGVKREIHRNINSVGIVDDVNDMVKDIENDTRSESSVTSSEETSYPKPEAPVVANTEPISFVKKTDEQAAVATEQLIAEHQNETAQSRIETDKTQL